MCRQAAAREPEATGALMLKGRNNASIMRLAAMVETIVARVEVVVAEGDKEDTGDLVVSPMGKKTGIALTQRTTASSRLATLVEP